MSVPVTGVPRPEWSPLPHSDCRGVEGKVLLALPRLHLAMLRFQPGGTIHDHAADHDIDVIVLEGEGMTSVGSETVVIAAGQSVRWPAGMLHRLWAEGGPLVTLMVEHTAGGA